jgi:hypothetical protein
MSYATLIQTIKTTTENLKNLDLDSAIEANLAPWSGMTKDEYRIAFQDLVETLDKAIQFDHLESLPHNILSSINTSLSTLFTQTNNFVTTKNQAHFQASFQQLETNRTALRTWGIKSYIDYGQEIEAQISGFNSAYQNIIAQSREIDALKESVKNLIEPAVSGSLSKAFSDRQEKLKSNRRVWFWLSVATGIIATFSTFYIVNCIAELFDPAFPKDATPLQIEKILKREIPKTAIALLRIGILIPVYGLFIYSFKHYNKERNLEEEYAHRAAVASSLPNYGNLAADPEVKDQIVSSASNVIFTSPIESKRRAGRSGKAPSMEELNNLIAQIGKITGLKE